MVDFLKRACLGEKVVACAEAAPSRAHVSFQGSSFGKWRGDGQSRAGTMERHLQLSHVDYRLPPYLPYSSSTFQLHTIPLTEIFYTWYWA